MARQLPPECVGNSADAQDARLLHHLKHRGPITSTRARHELDILHPPGRVKELRKRGYNIHMQWVSDNNSNGKPHRVGLYTLLSEPKATGMASVEQ